ncbi:MAG: glycosyltransferase family 39 protein [Candidatus Omnitrophica bacterium]|nr:glycosyltransferase family 39 protein [Candidatus Omnitrophota bacterium]
MNLFVKNTLTFILLCILCVSIFVIRTENFKNSNIRSIDEYVYYTMGLQVSRDIRDYNVIPYTKVLFTEEKYVPKYMLQPLYKHPPLFVFSIAAAIKMFGEDLLSAIYTANFFGALLIPLTYLLGSLLFSRTVGILAALYMWLDPITTIASQKVWMDTTLAFWTVLSVYMFGRGLFREKNFFFILSGIASGFAINTKYTGYLATIAIGLYAIFYQRHLFKNKTFLFSLALPLFMLIPWILWNVQVYGLDHLFSAQGGMHTGVGEALGVIREKIYLLALIVIAAGGAYYLVRKKYQGEDEVDVVDDGVDDVEPDKPSVAVKYFSYGVCGVIIFLLSPNICNSFIPYFVPSDSWAIGYFHGQPTWFYFGRLIEFSFIYLLGIMTLFLFEPERRTEKSLAVITVGIIIIFYISWRNYQSRYILPSLPFLLILSCDTLLQIATRLNKLSHRKFWYAYRGIFYLIWVFSIYHTMIINFALSYTNNVCYY